MLTVRRTEIFAGWLKSLRDDRAKARIANRIDRLANGNFGDVKSVGAGVSELQIDYGPAYRVYFVRRGTTLLVRLCGGDKSSRSRDIDRAKILALTS